MQLVRRLAALLFVIALPVALVTTNVRIAVNEPRLYEYAADEYDTPATTGIARDEILTASGELREYFNNDEDHIFVRVQKDREPVSLFTPRETAHLRDVKTLLQSTFRVQEATIVFVLAYVVLVFIWAREGGLRALAGQVLLSSVAALLVVGAVGAFAIAGFHRAWDQFHQIIFSFSEAPWQFNPARDHLIQMFPQAFWRDVSLWVGIGTLAELGALALATLLYLGVTRNARQPYALPPGAQVQPQRSWRNQGTEA